MKNSLILIAIGFAVSAARAESFSEKVKISDLRCSEGRAVVYLRSFEADRYLYLASDLEGEPRPLQMSGENCRALIRHLGGRLIGQVLFVDFYTESFERKESVDLPPTNPCTPRARKCDDQWNRVERVFRYSRTQTIIDGFRFYAERKNEI